MSGNSTLTLQPTSVEDVDGDHLPDTAMQLLASGDFTQGNAAGGLSGGIGIDNGVVFSTGRVSDINGPGENASEASTFGAEGPNNAEPESFNGWAHSTAERIWFPGGEVGEGNPNSGDPDLNAEQPAEDGFDAVALTFTITLLEKGKLQIKTVLASDEHPEFVDIDSFNDAVAVFVTAPSIPQANRNMLQAVIGGQEQPFTAGTLSLSTPRGTFYFENQSVSDPDDQLEDVFFNHEYDMFTKVLTRETKDVLGPGTYTVKVVLQDVSDA